MSPQHGDNRGCFRFGPMGGSAPAVGAVGAVGGLAIRVLPQPPLGACVRPPNSGVSLRRQRRTWASCAGGGQARQQPARGLRHTSVAACRTAPGIRAGEKGAPVGSLQPQEQGFGGGLQGRSGPITGRKRSRSRMPVGWEMRRLWCSGW